MRALQDKVALASGSGRGIGRAVAEKLAAAGARLCLAPVAGPVMLGFSNMVSGTGGRIARA